MGHAEEQRGQKLLLRRLREMGISAEPMPCGRALLGELRLRPVPFTTPTGPRSIERVRFASVGPQHLKCVWPRLFFHLPLISIGGCNDAGSVEDRLRAAWSRHLEMLRAAASRLEELGSPFAFEEDGAVLSAPLESGDGSARMRLLAPSRLALPSRGPLSGIRLERAEERVFTTPPDLESAIDLELAVTTRLEELARRAARHEATRRLHHVEIEAPPGPGVARRGVERRILLVGPGLARQGALVQALRVRGYLVAGARSVAEAEQAFVRSSFDVVMAEAQLGREEAVDLVAALQHVPGVSAVPVVIVDDRLRPARRAAAQQAGAAGYVAGPVDLARIGGGLARLASGHRGRRYARYPLRLGVRFGEARDGGVTLEVSRLGMFVRTDRESRLGQREQVELALPGLSRTLPVEAEIVYRVEAAGERDPGLGLRLRGFARGEDEAAWIAAVCALADDAAA